MNAQALAVQGVGYGELALATQGALVRGTAFEREVAVQGVGYGPGSMALQGFYRTAAPMRVGPGRRQLPARKRRDRDDDVLMFLLR